MFKYAVIHEASRVVVNVALWDGEARWHPGEGLIVVRHDSAGIGDIYDPATQTFSRPLQQPTVE